MSRPIVFMFPGQGSHYYHMGRDLFDSHPVFREWMKWLDKIVIEILGESVIDILYNKDKRKSDVFSRTLYTYPAIFMVEYSLFRVLLNEGIEPDFVLGSSMGEFASAACADIMDVNEILILLIKQAYVLEECCDGGMLAVLERAEIYNDEPLFLENCELASVNYNGHFVVSGKIDGLRKIGEFLKKKEINYQFLPVTRAFHSLFIDRASNSFISFLRQQHYRSPTIPFISCYRTEQLSMVSDTFFWHIVRKPVLFQETVQKMEEKDDYIYLDLGPSGTLSNFIKYNLREDSGSKNYCIMTPYGHEMKNLKAVSDCLRIKS